MTNPGELADVDLVGQAQLVRDGQLTGADLVEAAISRIAAVNPALNAVVRTMFEEGRRSASARGAGEKRFAGAPFLVKDLYCHYTGVPTSGGSRLTADVIPDHDSELMLRYRRAGLSTLGKTNLCEFGTLGTTEPVLFGPTLNPWNEGRSSGGAGAAVASGMVSAAHGGDGAGSIRIPASCCGVFDLKPTRGRISMGPDVGEGLAGVVNEHVLSMSVRDSAALLDATCGPSPGDPYWAAPPPSPSLSEVGLRPGRLCIAVSPGSLIGTQVHPDCVEAVEDVARLCEQLGHEVTFDAPAVDAEEYDRRYRRFWAMTATRSIWGVAERLGRFPEELAAQAEDFDQYVFSVGRNVRAVDFVQDLAWFQRLGRTIAEFQGRHDVWLTPTLGFPPPPLEHFDAARHGGGAVMDRFMRFLAFTTFANMAGLPSMSVPLSWNGEGLPIGSQFIGRQGEEATLLRLAGQLEEARPWRHRRPPVWAGDARRTGGRAHDRRPRRVLAGPEELRRAHAGRERHRPVDRQGRVPDDVGAVRLGKDHHPDDAGGLRGSLDRGDPARGAIHPERPAAQA